jgi:hypothetical protein
LRDYIFRHEELGSSDPGLLEAATIIALMGEDDLES